MITQFTCILLHSVFASGTCEDANFKRILVDSLIAHIPDTLGLFFAMFLVRLPRNPVNLGIQ